jgi:hypothetical protein
MVNGAAIWQLKLISLVIADGDKVDLCILRIPVLQLLVIRMVDGIDDGLRYKTIESEGALFRWMMSHV